MNDYIVKTYIAYLPVAILLTFIVARIFFKNSKIFMLDIFNGRQEIALSTNHLFEVGFYLLSLGFALFNMQINKNDFTSYQDVMTEKGSYSSQKLLEFGQQDMFEMLSSKVGLLSVALGLMVFFLMFMLFRGKRKSAENKARKARTEALAALDNSKLAH